MSQERFIKVERTARLSVYGNLTSKTRRIWLVAHGYGQLSKYFIKHFETLDPNEHFVLAPEGLSKAYINGLTGRVGASWMTREMREYEIEDYTSYFDQVLEEFIPEDLLKTIPLTAFGFSQGGATISRWAHATKQPISQIIIWGGEIAKELFSVNSFNNLPLIFVFGHEDVYISEVKRRRLEEQISEKGWTFHIYSYSGGHQLDADLISRISKDLE